MIKTNWEDCKLADVADVISGKNQRYVENPEGVYPIYGSAGIFGYADNYICEAGTTIVGRKGTINSPLYVKERFWNVDTAFGLHPIQTGLSSKYLYYFCLGFNFITLDKSTTIPSLSKRDILAIDFQLPPLKEQVRIVTKIETLFSELDKGIESLTTAREQLKVYRQSLLKHAFEGKLTEQWRKDNVGELETASELLGRIQQERETRYQQQLADWEKAIVEWEEGGKKGKRPSKPLLRKNSNWVIKENSPWPWVSLGGIAQELVLGKMLDKMKNKGQEQPYLGNINVRWGRFNLSGLKHMRIEGNETARYSLEPGDLVICEGGEPGRCAIWEFDKHSVFIQKALHRARFTESYNSKFAYYFMVFSAQSGILAAEFTGTTIKHLTGKGLEKILFPLCGINEQNKILDILEFQFSDLDTIENELKENLLKSQALRQSILKKAFSGQLVPQDPNDEPASELLKRIAIKKSETETAAKAAKIAAKKSRKKVVKPK